MLKNIVRLEVKLGEKIYHLLCDNDSPIEHVKEALFQFTKGVASIEEQIASAKKEAEAAKPAVQAEVTTEEVK